MANITETVVNIATGETTQRTVADFRVPPNAAALKAYAAQKRWEKEMGGMTVGGMPIKTDTEARVKIRELKDNIASGKLSAPYRFKAVSGWVAIDEATLTAVYDAIVQFVDDCFTTEDTVSQSIDARTITTFAAIDAAFAE